MKFTLLILLLLTKSCQSQDIDEKVTETKANNKVLIEYTKPIKGFNVKINWTLNDSIPYRNSIVGPALMELKRISDNKIFKINYENYSISDSLYSQKIYETYKEKSVPNILQLKACSEFYFKDINFDNNDELIINSEIFDEETLKSYSDHRIFEFINDELIEIDYFPTEALDWSGEINYEKKEVIVRDYLNCCSYIAYFYKYNKNSSEKFIMYKEETHYVDGTTEDEEIIVKEKGKAEVKIFKKKQ